MPNHPGTPIFRHFQGQSKRQTFRSTVRNPARNIRGKMGVIVGDFTKDEIREMRLSVGRILKREICRSSDPEVTPTTGQITAFFKERLGSREKRTERNLKIFGYSDYSAKAAIRSIIAGEPYFPDGIGHGSNAHFESELVKFLNSLPDFERPIPRFLFRKGFDGSQLLFADPVLISESRDEEFIVNQLFDLCGEMKENRPILESQRILGLFMVAVVRVRPSRTGPVGSITVADLFDGSIALSKANIEFGGCKVDRVERISPPGKPVMNDDDFFRHICSVYDRGLEESVGEEPLIVAQKQFLGDCIKVIAEATMNHLEPMDRLADKSIGCGKLIKVVLDVEHGAIFARQVDQGRLWIVAMTSIEDTVYQCFELFGKSLADTYEVALKASRRPRR